MVPLRNKELIVEKIGWVFSINMILNSLWLIVFEQNKAWTFGVSLAIIIGMLATQIFIMRHSTRSKVNIPEFIGLRIGFTIYSVWVTAATILNVTFFLKSLGFEEPNAGFTEHVWTVIVLWVALVIYWACTFVERNPLYGFVLFWVISAIRSKQMEIDIIATNTLVILIVHAVYMSFILALTIYEKVKGKCDKGLFY